MNILDVIKGSEATDFDTLRGEFTQVSPSKLASPTSRNPIARAHFALIRELARMHVPLLPVSPAPEDFEAVADYYKRVVSLFDITWAQPVGEEIASNSPIVVDLRMFTGQFFGAIDGNATAEIDAVCEAMRDGQDEDADADYRHDEQSDGLSHS